MAIIYDIQDRWLKPAQQATSPTKQPSDFEYTHYTKIIPFHSLSLETAEKALGVSNLILVCWRYSYEKKVNIGMFRKYTGNMIRATYVTKTGRRKCFVLWFGQNNNGTFSPFRKFFHEHTLKEGFAMINDGIKRFFNAPSYLLKPGKDRRKEYLSHRKS